MQPLATLVASLVLGAGAAVGVSTYMTQHPDQESGTDAAATQVATRVGELEKKIEQLTEQLQKAQAGSTAERRSLDVVSDAQIEAAVAKYLKRDGAAVARRAAAKKSAAGAASLKQTFQQLQGELSEDELQAVWKQLKKDGKADEMLQMFVDAAAANPNSTEAQVQAGYAYLMRLQDMPPGQESGKLAMQADQAFDRTLKLDPNHWDARFVKAQALSFWPPMFGKQAEAIKHLQTLVTQQEASATQQPKFARTYWTLGNLYSAQGKTKEAMAIWKKGSVLFPDHAGLRKKTR